MEYWTEDRKKLLKVGSVVQLSPDCTNPLFKLCLVNIEEIKSWGVQGFVLAPNSQAYYYRARWNEIKYVGECAWEVTV